MKIIPTKKHICHTLGAKSIYFLVLVALQIIVGLCLLLYANYVSRSPRIYSFDLSEDVADSMYYDGTALHVNSDLNGDGETSNLNLGMVPLLSPGSYTLVVHYDSEKQRSFLIASHSGAIPAKAFSLSKNKTVGTYDFYATQDVDNLECFITDYDQGYLNIYDIQIIENNHNFRIMFFYGHVFPSSWISSLRFRK